MPRLMETYDALPPNLQAIAKAMSDASREAITTSGHKPRNDDAAAHFDEACAVYLLASMGRQRPPQKGCTTIATRPDGQVYAAEHNGDNWQTVYPSDEAQLSACFNDEQEAIDEVMHYLSNLTYQKRAELKPEPGFCMPPELEGHGYRLETGMLDIPPALLEPGPVSEWVRYWWTLSRPGWMECECTSDDADGAGFATPAEAIESARKHCTEELARGALAFTALEDLPPPHVFEVTGADFTGDGETEDSVFWIRAETAQQVHAAIADTGAKFCGIVNADPAGSLDYDLSKAGDAARLSTALLKCAGRARNRARAV